ncbi:terpenoid synthase [Hypoxylon sp. FL0890]|nr:terpenoid synthase [Hypoxylon sp. FL0890]
MSKENNEANVESLLSKCVGRTVKIPDLFALCPWDVEISSWDVNMEREVELWRSRWIKDPTSLKRNRIIDPCLFARSAAPKAATFDGQLMVAKWAAWTFYWDDGEIHMPWQSHTNPPMDNVLLSVAHDFGEFDDRPEEVIAHRDQTIELFRQSLYNDHPSSVNPAEISPDYLTAQSVHEWGAVVGETCVSPSLKDWLFKVFSDTCIAISRVQQEFEEKNILDLETYRKIRIDSSGSLTTLACILYADQVAFPDWFFNYELVKKAADLTAIIIWVINDITSVRHEVQCKHVDNYIPLLVYHKGLTPQEAIDEAARIAHQAYLDFEALEPQLTRLGKTRGCVYEMQRFIASCKFECSGIINWHYQVKRYVPWKPGMDRDNLYVVLGEDLPSD